MYVQSERGGRGLLEIEATYRAEQLNAKCQEQSVNVVNGHISHNCVYDFTHMAAFISLPTATCFGCKCRPLSGLFMNVDIGNVTHCINLLAPEFYI
jgi:hypothetical protein